MRCKIGSILADLGPSKFNRIEFWSTDRKVIDMQAAVLSNEFLNQSSLMDRMVIPNQYDLAWDDPQQLLQKGDDLFSSQAMSVRADRQFDLVSARAHQECVQQVQPLMMCQTGPDSRRTTARCPTSLERRDQRETTFIFKHQRSKQFTPLFLSLARLSVSRKRWLPRRVGLPSVVPFGCSSRCGP